MCHLIRVNRLLHAYHSSYTNHTISCSVDQSHMSISSSCKPPSIPYCTNGLCGIIDNCRGYCVLTVAHYLRDMPHFVVERRRILDPEGVRMYRKKRSILSYQHKYYMHSTPFTGLRIVGSLLCSSDRLRCLLLATFKFPSPRDSDSLLHQSYGVMDGCTGYHSLIVAH